jgi:hypothetical protein
MEGRDEVETYNLDGFIAPDGYGRNPTVTLCRNDINKAPSLTANAGYLEDCYY